jgi:hypothetical protein
MFNQDFLFKHVIDDAADRTKWAHNHIDRIPSLEILSKPTKYRVSLFILL